MRCQSAIFSFTFLLLFLEIIPAFPVPAEYEGSGESYEKDRYLKDIPPTTDSPQEEETQPGADDIDLDAGNSNEDIKSVDLNQTKTEIASSEESKSFPKHDQSHKETSKSKPKKDAVTSKVTSNEHNTKKNAPIKPNVKNNNDMKSRIGNKVVSKAKPPTLVGGVKTNTNVLPKGPRGVLAVSSLPGSDSKQRKPFHPVTPEQRPRPPISKSMRNRFTNTEYNHPPQMQLRQPPAYKNNDIEAQKLGILIKIAKQQNEIMKTLSQISTREDNIEEIVYHISRHFPDGGY